MSQQFADNKLTFQSDDAWMVQCLSLATIGMLAYMHLSSIIIA